MTRLAIFREDKFLGEHVLMRATVGLGRHPENDIVLDDLTLSRFHARLERRGDAYVVVDLGAQNGVYLNGHRITGERDLSPGDRIGLGHFFAIFDQTAAETARRRSDGNTTESAAADEAEHLHEATIGLDDASLDDLSIDLDESDVGVAIEVDVDLDLDVDAAALGSEASDEAFFDDGQTAEIPSVEATGHSQVTIPSRSSAPVLVLLYNGLEVSRQDVSDGPMIVGRSKASDVVISLLGLSRRHTRIHTEADRVFVEDLGSQNGTWVNNQRIEGARRIQHGDLLNYYEYGLLFLEDPSVEISLPSANVDVEIQDGMEAVETGRQDGISIGTMKAKASTPRHRVGTVRSPVPMLSSEADVSAMGEPAGGSLANERSAQAVGNNDAVDRTDREPSVADMGTDIIAAPKNGANVDEGYDPFDGFDLEEHGQGGDDYLAAALDESEASGSLEGDALLELLEDDEDEDHAPSHTQILLKEIEEEQPAFLQDAKRDEVSSFRDGGATGPAISLHDDDYSYEEDNGPHITSDKTSAMELPNIGGYRAAWPTEDELEPALRDEEQAPLVQLEVFLDDKLYTQFPLSQPVVRVGTDARCELALPSAAGLAPWQFTLIPFGSVILCYRASRDARVVVDEVVVDQAVLHDGDEVNLGRVRVRVRVR